METLSLRRNPLKGFESEHRPDLEHKVESVEDELVEKALREYEKLEVSNDYYKAEQEIKSIEIVALNPQKIDVLLQKIIQLTPQEKTNNRITGQYISRLIQQSHNNGHNEFVLTTKDTIITDLCYGLTSQERLRINIHGNTDIHLGLASQNCTYTITGNTDLWLGQESQNCIYAVTGNTGNSLGLRSQNCNYMITGNTSHWLGQESQNCTYTITGNTGDQLGDGSQDCTYIITGNTEDSLGSFSNSCTYTITGNSGSGLGLRSQNCTYTIAGNTGNDLGPQSNNCTYTIHGKIGKSSGTNAVNCTFRTTVEETYKKLISSVDKDKGNRVQLIDKDGNILSEVKLWTFYSLIKGFVNRFF